MTSQKSESSNGFWARSEERNRKATWFFIVFLIFFIITLPILLMASWASAQNLGVTLKERVFELWWVFICLPLVFVFLTGLRVWWEYYSKGNDNDQQ